MGTPVRRVVLVDLYWTRDKDPRVPLGHASLLAALQARTRADVRSVVLAVNAPGTGADAVVRAILGAADDLGPGEVDVAIGVYVWNEALVQALLPALRSAGFQGRIVLGGPQISYAGAGVDRLYPDADAFVRGPGEEALAALVLNAGEATLPGIHFQGEPDRTRQATVSLASLPSPWLDGVIPLEGQRFIRWETQRGCQFACTFCQHRDAGAGRAVRRFPMDRLLQEIDLFCRAGVEEIAVLDPVFNQGAAVEILRAFAERGFTGRLSLQCRAELVDHAFLDAAERLDVALELGLQTIEPREFLAVGRPNHLKKIDLVLAELRHRRIHHEVSLIFGLPEQTLRSFLETVRWCLDRQVPVIRAFPLLLLRGTALERDRARWGLVTDGGPMEMAVESTTFRRADWEAMARVSQALQLTEGRHPRRLDELLERSEAMEPDRSRWQVRAEVSP
ncbi:MAG TPA: radical SAM protein [Myxococcaceae bacterium]